MKKYIFLAASALTLASCSSDDFLGDTPGSTPTSANSAIKFDGNAGKISRTSNTGSAPEMLGKEFKIYGVKSGTETGSGYTPVFINYLLWYDEETKNNTTTNNRGWEYVGDKGNHGDVNLKSDQYIKFWDYASADYRFVAGAPSSAFTFNTKNDEKYIETATITGLGGHINANSTGPGNTFNPIYVAEPKVVAKANYKELVQFNFVRQQSMVRVGIYETIPGYKIKEIKFYKQGEDGTLQVTNDNNIILTSATPKYFVGGTDVTGTITYNWTTPSYSLAYNESDALKKSQNWYGGALTNGVEATKTTGETVAKLYGTDKDMDTNTGYFTVMSTPENTTETAILMKCNYTLISEDNSGETIKVTGATAAIPAAYSKWENNTRYTYLFKISENTNGYTGTDPDKTGLYPITFDAAVKDTELGTVTTFTTPSITTKQDGSVTDNGIEYKTGKEIAVTVTDEKGNVQTLSTGGTSVGNVTIYSFNKEITEAEMQILGPKSGTEVSCTANSNVVTFTPEKAGWYVIQYLAKTKDTDKTPAVYTYKVVNVVKAATKE